MPDHLFAIVNSLNAPFWHAARLGRLCLPHCEVSGRAFWPPSPVSPYSEQGAVLWREVDPAGEMKARVVYRRLFVQAFESLMPYGIGLIELDAGPRMLAHISRPDDTSSPRQGDRVCLIFEKLANLQHPVLTVHRYPDSRDTTSSEDP